MTKPIKVVKVPCKLLYVIQVKEFLIKCSTSWPYLISEFLVVYITIVASDWPCTFLHPRCFCLACIYTCGIWPIFLNKPSIYISTMHVYSYICVHLHQELITHTMDIMHYAYPIIPYIRMYKMLLQK